MEKDIKVWVKKLGATKAGVEILLQKYADVGMIYDKTHADPDFKIAKAILDHYITLDQAF